MAVRYHGKLRPLPDTYPAMSTDEQRHARLNALAVQQTPRDTTLAWSLWHNHYMKGTRKRDLPSPPLHYEWVYACANWARNMIAAPRSFAKSTIVGKEWPLFLAVTRPGTEVLVVVSTDPHARRRGQWFLHQLRRNDAIREDFGDQCGDRKRDGRMWTFHEIDLVNGSKIVVTSVRSIQLGSRPDVIVMDDVEPDPEKVKNWERIVEELNSALFDVFLPMLDAGTSMVWIGTLLHRRSFLYWAMTTPDSRLQFWHRMLTAIEDKNGVPQWPQKFSKQTIAQLKAELKHKFWAQFMNEPISGDKCVLELHPKRSMYYVRSRDDSFIADPLSSQAELLYYTSINKAAGEFSDQWIEATRPLGKALTEMYRFITVDYAEGTEDHHDFSAIHVLGEDNEDCLWSLDLWMGRDTLGAIEKKVWEYAYRWKVRLVAIESVGGYKALYEYALRNRAEMERQHGWIPRLLKVSYPAHLSKPVRIAGLEWRFAEGRVRIPDYQTAAYQALRHQIVNFTMDEAALKHDDAIDTLAMHASVLRPRVKLQAGEAVDKARISLAQRLVRGELLDQETGVAYAGALGSDEIPYKAVRAALEAKADKHKKIQSPLELPLEFSLAEIGTMLRGHNAKHR